MPPTSATATPCTLVLAGLSRRCSRGCATCGSTPATAAKARTWIRAVLGWTVEVVKRPQRWVWLPEGAEPPPMPTGFQVLKRRWVVERTFAWLGRYRRLSKDYEVLPATEEAWIYLATTNLLVRRLAR